MDCFQRCENWPLPNLKLLPCLPPGIQPDEFCEILEEANETVSQHAGYCYNGCECWAELQICPLRCQCDNYCNCSPCFLETANLSTFLGHPVHEVLEVKVNGQPIADLSDWSILDNCDLVCPPTGWPAQYLAGGPTGDCTWTVTVRYGTKIPRRLVRLRDKYFFELLKECFPSSQLFCDKKGVTKVQTKSGTYEFEGEESVLEQIACNYGPSLMGLAGFYDPADPSYNFKILNIASGSLAESQSCEDALLEWVEDQQTDEPVEMENINQSIPQVGRVYNHLGQPVR